MLVVWYAFCTQRKEAENMNELQTEIAFYEAQQEQLEETAFGKWVLIHREDIIGTYDTFQEAALDAAQRFETGPYLIRQIGAKRPQPSAAARFGGNYAYS